MNPPFSGDPSTLSHVMTFIHRGREIDCHDYVDRDRGQQSNNSRKRVLATATASKKYNHVVVSFLLDAMAYATLSYLRDFI